MAKMALKVTFSNFMGLLICYRAHFSVLETVETICVAISLKLTPFFHKLDYMNPLTHKPPLTFVPSVHVNCLSLRTLFYIDL